MGLCARAGRCDLQAVGADQVRRADEIDMKTGNRQAGGEFEIVAQSADGLECGKDFRIDGNHLIDHIERQGIALGLAQRERASRTGRVSMPSAQAK